MAPVELDPPERSTVYKDAVMADLAESSESSGESSDDEAKKQPISVKSKFCLFLYLSSETVFAFFQKRKL